MKSFVSISKYFTIAFIFMIAGTLKAQSILSQDFESFTLGDSTSIGHVSWAPTDIKTVIVADPLGSGSKVLKVTTTGYGAAPVLKFVLPAGKTLADYDSLTFDAYYQSGDLSYKLIVGSAYQTNPIGHHFLDADTNYSYNRTQGVSTGWERISLAANTISTFSDTVYIAIGTNNSGATWYMDSVNLVAKTSTPIVLGTGQDFESFTLGDSTSIGHVSWAPTDIKTVIVADPLGSGSKVLKVTTTAYGAAPVLKFVLPAGKTLADYDSLTFDAYYQSGDLTYKLIVGSAYQTDPTGHHFLDADTNYSFNRTQGASTSWERISMAAYKISTFSDTVYIAIGTNNSGAVWYMDNVNLIAKVVTPPPPQVYTGPVVTNGGFEDSNVGNVDSMTVKGWIFQSDAGLNPDIQIVSDTVEQGKRALSVTVHTVGANPWSIQAVADSIHVVPGVTYNYSIWAKASKNGAQANFTIGNYSYAEYGAIRPANLTTNWQKFTMQFKVNDGQTVIRGPIHFSMAVDTGVTIWIDNLQIVDANASKEPVTIQAESGVLGSNYAVMQDNADTLTYITPQNTYTGLNAPGDTSRIATYQVTFPDTGYYNLFARVRVGSGGYNSDSFFYGKGFGVKNDTASADWVMINGLASSGFINSNDIVDGPGTQGTQVWKWVNVTKNFHYNQTVDSFYVGNADSLTQTFQIGSRELGLDIDKIAFATTKLYFTVNDLDNGLPGQPTNFIDSSQFYQGPPLAQGAAKFLGNVKSAYGDNNFANFWNQMTPGNEGKWGSIAGSQDTTTWNWKGLDTLYNYAMAHHMIFKDHNLIWGQQQPSWISSLDSATQLKYIETWIRMVGERYPKINMIDVVNEPLPGHNPPDGQNGRANYENALGGAGSTGWDWVIKAFELARKYLPNAKLLINDYGIINDNTATTNYLTIINLLKDRGLIDGIGVQGHRFELESADTTTLKNNLARLGATGLPVYISEFDLGNIGNTGTPDDNTQLQLYKKIFPILWTSPAVKGITLWGYMQGEMWQTTCYLVRSDNTWRPAMTWLAQYVKDNPLTGVDQAASNVPARFELMQNYPNPFNPSTRISYSLAKPSKVTLRVYNILGQEVQTLVNREQTAGNYTFTFDAQNLASGVYFYQIQAGNFVATKKLMLLK